MLVLQLDLYGDGTVRRWCR